MDQRTYVANYRTRRQGMSTFADLSDEYEAELGDDNKASTRATMASISMRSQRWKLSSWKPNTDDAFLVLDLNLNGLIDDGSELFGHGTTILGTGDKAGDGFIALQQYDAAALGGNDDGKLKKKDQIWGSLGLWIDSNRDGVSQDGELHELSDFGVRKISLNVREGSTDPDRAGNLLPIWSWVTTEDTVDLPNKLKMADVFFRRID